ncbi:FAR1-related sequence 5-like protein [Tanacetum coccineum]|uniref:Protein FAR1-RELATED SEQUENCE n=1 Tax=Tanacetum coccineum TaxID=301880 RepID=A0ABQ5DUV1_9ASTR
MNGSPPISIITDQDLAMGNAIAKVFPKTRHRFCAWHIQKHVLEHLQPLRFRYDDFQDTYNQWVKTPNVEDFELKWEHLKEKYLISKDSWLGNMYNLRQYWVKAYLNDTFFAGMTTSGRSESMHSFFDGFVNSKTMLNDFVQQYDKAVSSRRGAEKDQDFRTLNSKPSLQGDHPIEAMAAKCYTRNLYDVFMKNWKASFDCGHKKITKDSSLVQYRVGFLQGNVENWKVVECKIGSEFFATCSCAKFETFRILCKHILYIMRRKLLTIIPNHYILPRWTMKAIDLVGNIGTECRGADVNKEVSLLTLWSIRNNFTKILEDGKDSPLEIKKLDHFLNGILEEQNMRKKA